MRINSYILMSTVMIVCGQSRRQKRYLIFTPATQWGVFATVSVPLHPETTTSVAWFFEANYFTVDNTTYYQALLGDVQETRSRRYRNIHSHNNGNVLTRQNIYSFLETMLERHGYPGRGCVLRAVCDCSSSQLTHNGVLGDLLHLLFTPSTSIEETEIEDAYYEAEYRGIHGKCKKYTQKCPNCPLQLIMKTVDSFL